MLSGITLNLEGAFAGLRATNSYTRDYVATPTILSGDVLSDDQPGFQNRADNIGPILRTETNGYPFSWTVRIDGIRFVGGHAEDNAAGGLDIDFVRSPIISNCTFEECDGMYGGGLRVSFISDDIGFADIRDCSFLHNRSANDGGGILVDGVASFLRCRITDNSCGRNGGGVGGHFVEASQSVVAGNQAMYGGGLYGRIELRSSLVVANRAIVGGGAFLTQGHVSQSTIADNVADYGGGLHLANTGYQIANSLLDRNTARLAGSQLSHTCLPGDLRLSSVLLRGGLNAVFAPFSGVVSLDSHVLDCDPRFVNAEGQDHDPSSWQDNDYHLRPGSCAIDAAEPAWGDVFDLDEHHYNLPRFPGGTPHPDLGCYEYLPHCPADVNGDNGVTVDDLLAFLNAYTLGLPPADIDDGSATNTPDDAVTIDDLLYFLARYNQGC